MRPPRTAVLLAVLGAALLLGAAACGKSGDEPGVGKQAQEPPPLELTAFEKKVILALGELEKTPAASDFIRELDADTDLRAAVERGPREAELGRFKALVQRHAKNEDFRQAVENPSPLQEAPPCGSPEPAKEPTVLAAPDKTLSPLEAAKPGCAAESPPLGEQDILIPPPPPVDK